jgi:hypothetical protein
MWCQENIAELHEPVINEHLVRVTAHEASVAQVQMLADIECDHMENERVVQDAAARAKVEADWELLVVKEKEDQRYAAPLGSVIYSTAYRGFSSVSDPYVNN